MSDSTYSSVSEELADLFARDQADRTVGHENIDFAQMRENDIPRLARAKEFYAMLKSGEANLSGEELYMLGMLYQHSPDANDYKVAMELGALSGEKGCAQGSWLSAAAEDRLLLSTGGKQKWGTQFTKESGEWEQMPMDSDEESGVTDVLRAQKNIPPRNRQMEVFLARNDI